jgi:exo-beta-1,3-glucanase (GH17 family)
MRERASLIACLIGVTTLVSLFLLVRVQPGLRSEIARIETGEAQANTDTNGSLRDQLFGLRYVAYSPTGWNPENPKSLFPADESLRKDLKVLREAGFEGLVTYGGRVSTAVPKIAGEVGFRGILLGVWDPNSVVEMEEVKLAARNPLVVGIIVGNEGLMFKRYDLQSLHNAMGAMKRATGKPISTTEIIESYLASTELIEWSDFLAPNAHPFFHGKGMKQPRRAVEWTSVAYRELSQRAAGKPLLFKEVGLPSGGEAGLSEENQAEYYALLQETDTKFVFFESFDSPWKSGAVEPHWGLFRANRSPKRVVKEIMGSRPQ